ncbi:MAG: Plug domain-containing protein [Nitrosomonadales bacterium]
MDIIEKKSVVRKQAYHFLRHSVIALAVAATFGRAALADDSVSTVAAPQQKSDTDSNSGSVQSLEKVTVTSEFRTEDLQDVPSTINVIGGNTIRDNEVRNTQDLILYVPNMSADTSDEHGRPKFYIRGLGLSDASVWNTSPVGVYQDDVYIWNSSTLGFPLFDLERVEVLSGPQGTLYGRTQLRAPLMLSQRNPALNPMAMPRFQSVIMEISSSKPQGVAH